MDNKGKNVVFISNDTIVRVFLVAILILVAWILRDLILVVLTSVVMASFAESAVPFFKKMKISRVTGIAVLYTAGILLFAGLFYLFAPLLITELYNFATFLSNYIPNSTFLNYFQNDAFSGAKDVVVDLSNDMSINTLLKTSEQFISNISGGFFSTMSVAFGSIFNAILIVVISFYIAIKEKGVEDFLRIILPTKHEEYVVGLWSRTQRKIALWMRGQFLLGILIFILTYLVLSLLGIKYAFLLALIAGIMELVPYGILVAVIPAVFFSYVSGGVSSALMVFGAYTIIHQFDLFLFTPLIIKRVIGLSPIVMILSVLVGLELGGFWGLILAIPAAVLLMEIINDMSEKKKALKE